MPGPPSKQGPGQLCGQVWYFLLGHCRALSRKLAPLARHGNTRAQRPPSPHTHRAASEISGFEQRRFESPGFWVCGCVCVCCERGSYLYLSPPHNPTPPPSPHLRPALRAAGRSLGIAATKAEPGYCASRACAWELATACPGQEAGLLGSQLGRTLSPECHETVGVGLWEACTAHTCRLPGINIHSAPTDKGPSILPSLSPSCPRPARGTGRGGPSHFSRERS